MSKRWTLDEHIRDIEDWESDRGNLFASHDRVFFIAYERWLNDRDLLTLEDGYEWISARIAPPWAERSALEEMSPSPKRLLTGSEGFLTRADLEKEKQ